VGIIIDGEMKVNDTTDKVKALDSSNNLENVFFNLVEEASQLRGEF